MLTVSHEPEKWGICSNVNTISSYGHKMRSNSVKLRYEHAYVFNAGRNIFFDAQHFFHSHYIAMFGIHRCHIIKPVNERDYLVIREIFGMLFKTAMKVAKMGNNFFYDFPS